MTPFDFHVGFEVIEKRKPDGEKLFESTCPFCMKENHFHFFEDSRYGCKKCGEKGNVYDLIRFIYKQSILDIGDLAKNRGLTQKSCADFKYNRFNGTVVLPTYKNGDINNLYKVGPEYRLMGTPGLGQTLYNWDETTEPTIWLCEGQWDRCAAVAILGNNEPITPIGIPGANSFKETWCAAVKEKDVVLIFDNDEAGEKGFQRTIDTFKESAIQPKSIKRVQWPADKNKGYDLRDHYLEHGRSSLKELQKYIVDINVPGTTKISTQHVIEDYTCDSYDKALDSFETAFHTTSDTRAALAAVMASIYSIKIPGEQLWFKIIGPPGCGKTRIAKAVSASDHVISRSTFTGLFSGHSDDNADDPGMVPLIANRTLFVKDADALLRQPNIEKIMAELRDFYDKDASAQYRNRRSYQYTNIKSTIIICGTQVLRRADQSFLGERFLSIELDMTESDKAAINKKMLQRSIEVAMGAKKDPEEAIMSSMKGWINHLRERTLDTYIPEEFQEILIESCKLTALMRTQVDRDFKRKVMSPPVSELPTRLIGQMVTATLSLGAVFGINKPDNSIFYIIAKILRDTINPRSTRFKICTYLSENRNVDFETLEHQLNIPKTTLSEEIDDLRELNLVHVDKIASSAGPGRKKYIFRLDDRISTPLKDIL